MTSIAVLTATAGEQDLLREHLYDAVCVSRLGRPQCHGSIGEHSVALVVTGMGGVNTAHGLTALLEARRPDLVLQLGVGGAYPGGGLGIGDLAVATEEIYGDVGVRTADGWQPADLIGIPLVEVAGVEFYNRFELDAELAGRARQLLTVGAEGSVAAGPFVTVQECTGTQALAEERGRLFPGALCENMEGAAAAHICRLYGVPLLEVRGISNLVEERRRQSWDLPGAATRAQQGCLRLLAELDL